MDKDTQPLCGSVDDHPTPTLELSSDLPVWGLVYWLKADSRDCERFVLGKETYTVGRGGNCDINLNLNNCFIKLENLSRVHCTFKRTPNVATGFQLILEDCSVNGTFVNGDKIGRGKSRALYHGDEIAFTCPYQKVSTISCFIK